jgi:S1/P1 Nuclease
LFVSLQALPIIGYSGFYYLAAFGFIARQERIQSLRLPPFLDNNLALQELTQSHASCFFAYLALVNPGHAWNIPGHMLSAAIAYQILQQENPLTIEKVKTVLEKHPWYVNQWQARIQDVPVADRDMVLLMQAARWPDELRITDRQHHRGPWHYINRPFKPEGQPASVRIKEPEQVNILTALAENQGVVKNESDPERKAIALAWLFHLVGDVHQCTRHSYSLLSIPRAIGAAMKSVCG